MNQQNSGGRRRRAFIGLLTFGALFQFGFVESCDERFVSFTRFFDPCGTILANCNPGDFEANAAPIGDFCIDPACTVPGQCGQGQPLGTITDICP